MRVVITGAAGRIGRQVVEELSASHELLCIDRRPVKGRKSLVVDLSQRPTTRAWRNWLGSKSSHWSDAFEGAQVVVHLSANPDQLAKWEKVLPDNIQGTWNVIAAAAQHAVSRVVFASSNWAVKALERASAPDCYQPNGPKIGSDAPPQPITAYGLSKAFGEQAGRMFVDEGKLKTFVAVRIGNYAPQPSKDEISRDRWIGAEDIRTLFRRCVEADLKGFHVVYGVSAQTTAPYDLSHTRKLLAWEPRQNAMDR
jgi:nucleoside-diphosphate-sugar epimerase